MEVKKYPSAILENYSKILMQLGLVLALFIVYEFINMKTYPTPVKELVGTMSVEDDTEEVIEIKPIEVLEPQAAKAVIPEKIVKVEDEVEIQETIIESTETDEMEAINMDINKDIVAVEEDEDIVEDVAFVVIENVPIFPGCKGNNAELRECFSNQISKFVAKRFNSELASDLGLTSGSIQKIFVMFKIDKEGNITDIHARAPHKKLQEEAIRVINLLPQMTPGKQRGRAVGVRYGLPIVFRVE
ncbi:energy transducer TonB [Lutibacter aestuarii]|uniref:Energy transducer TonB n=1 Tax=Lutibacter aestuarii TaxID=861111 RepID=A0ABW2Z687_9FLAO|nr:energy transducer TonB [uncultured Lutibacter sp.]